MLSTLLISILYISIVSCTLNFKKSAACPNDKLYSSIASDGDEMCSDLLDDDCADTPLPSQYSSYPRETISSYCLCVFRSCHHDPTSSSSSSTQVRTANFTTITAIRTTSTASAPWVNITLITANQSAVETPMTTTSTAPITMAYNTSTLVLSTTTSEAKSRSHESNTTIVTLTRNSTWSSVGPSLTSSSTASAPIFTNTTVATLTPTSSRNSTWSSVGPSLTSSSTVSAPTFTNTSSSSSSLTLPGMTQTMIPAANFSSVFQAVAPTATSCYHVPIAQDGINHGVMLHNSEIREKNGSLPYPFIESMNFDVNGSSPLLVAIRDGANGLHFLDISTPNSIAIVDSLGTSLKIDARGIHFATNQCQYDFSIIMDNLYGQLASKSDGLCSAKLDLFEMRSRRRHMNHTLYLHDQCGNAVGRSIRAYPELRVMDIPCNVMDVDDDKGEWSFDCLIPSRSPVLDECLRTVQSAVANLMSEPFNNACPALSTVITTLEATTQDILGPEAMRLGLYKFAKNDLERIQVNQTVVYYQQLWAMLKALLSKGAEHAINGISILEYYITIYNKYRNFEQDICQDLHPGTGTISVSLRAGSTYNPALLTLSTIPESFEPLHVTIQDPSTIACCSNGTTTNPSIGNATCAYPRSAFLGNTGCVCGKTADGQSVAFKYKECHNFSIQCSVNADCNSDGNSDLMCLTGSCCGHGICFDPYECS